MSGSPMADGDRLYSVLVVTSMLCSRNLKWRRWPRKSNQRLGCGREAGRLGGRREGKWGGECLITSVPTAYHTAFCPTNCRGGDPGGLTPLPVSPVRACRPWPNFDDDRSACRAIPMCRDCGQHRYGNRIGLAQCLSFGD
jgi:hypothetical protein